MSMRATAPSAFPGIWPSRASVIGRGGNIPTTSINRIIKNPLYIGILCNGESQSENVLTELQIIDVDLFERAQKMIESRAKPRTAHKEIPLNTRGQSLWVDINSRQKTHQNRSICWCDITCGCHCGRIRPVLSPAQLQRLSGT